MKRYGWVYTDSPRLRATAHKGGASPSGRREDGRGACFQLSRFPSSRNRASTPSRPGEADGERRSNGGTLTRHRFDRDIFYVRQGGRLIDATAETAKKKQQGSRHEARPVQLAHRPWEKREQGILSWRCRVPGLREDDCGSRGELFPPVSLSWEGRGTSCALS